MPEHYRTTAGPTASGTEVLSCAVRPTFVANEFVCLSVSLEQILSFSGFHGWKVFNILSYP